MAKKAEGTSSKASMLTCEPSNGRCLLFQFLLSNGINFFINGKLEIFQIEIDVQSLAYKILLRCFMRLEGL